MKNLKRIFSAIYEFPQLKETQCFCVGTEENTDVFNKVGHIYCYSDGIISLINDKLNEPRQIYDLRAYYEDSSDRIVDKLDAVNIEYQYVSKSLIVALANGDVFSLELDTNELQCIGSVDSGLKAMEWSPDFETVVFGTGQNTIILMSGSFDPINEINLFDTGPGVKQMVNVGWGKKETQFHGSEGKAARTAAPVQGSQVDDDIKTRISWRGDSTLFAVSFCSNDNKRVIKIFNQEGVLQCDGENLPGLEQSVCWRPSGNVIGLTQKLPNKHIVSFMEKNGLVHGNFVLPAETEVKELLWNVDSTILCVLCRTKLLLYSVSNYYWYLKQQINFTSPVLSVRWDSTTANVLHVFQSNGTYSVYQWSWSVYHTPSITESDGAFVAVIDGRHILLSSFKKKIIPPPMSDHTIKFSEPVDEIVFAPGQVISINQESNTISLRSVGCNINNFIAYLSNKKLAFVTDVVKEPKVIGEYAIENLEVACLHHFTWVSPAILLCCAIKPGGENYICELDISSENVTLKKCTRLEQSILSLVRSSNSSCEAVVQLVDGQLLKYSVGGVLVKEAINVHLSEPCIELSIYNNNIIALSELKRLYFNGDLITSKATSYFIVPPFVVITTAEHTLLIYKVNNIKCEQVSSRRLERGSKIVTVVHDNIILQMPRGNLETIQPRALTLQTAASLISRCEYRKLFNLFRKHRINMNLIVDHQPQTFLLTVTRFVHQINDPIDLSLFLSELADIDVTRGIYKDYYDQDDRPPTLDKKTERVCQALRGVMLSSGTETEQYLNPIITTYVKTNDMNEALNFASRSSSCLKHLLFLVDVDRLYDCALGLYNLEMAMKIAEKSKKDPKEYVPYLNNLKRMNDLFMKYTIDCHFRKYESALKNISQSSNDDHFIEALGLIEKHELYPLALQQYKAFPDRYKQVSIMFADHLMLKHSYEEAALLYTRCEIFDRALDAYADCGLWRNALIIALKLGNRDVNALGKRILPVLVRKGLWADAAALSQDVLKDYNLVVEYFVRGKLWEKAFYLAQITNIGIEFAIMPYLKDEATTLLEILRENVEKVKKHSARLTEVRLQKLKKKENLASDIDVSDMQSDISSVSSSSNNTSRTGGTQSSKNTRKMQKKMWSLKEGNPREEFALLSVISQLVQDLEKLTDDVSKTCSALLYCCHKDFDDLALNLQTSMKQALITTDDIKKTVWPPQPSENSLTTANELQDAQLKFPPSLCVKPMWNLKILNV